MPTVYVNNEAVEFGADEKINCIQAAQRVSEEIPHYCWHPSLSVVASCRMCLVEIGQKKPDGTIAMQPKLIPGCQTPVTDGMVIVSDSEKVKAGIELEIQPFEGDGLIFKRSDAEVARKIKFDGKDYPDLAPNADPGSAFSGRRVNERSLEIAEKLRGNITGTRQIELSPDLKTLTITVRLVGQNRPKSVLVFDRK